MRLLWPETARRPWTCSAPSLLTWSCWISCCRKFDGFGVCAQIRRQSQVPILMLTALDGETQQLRGFGLNIDDYVTKPFSMPVLLEKIRVILRRSGEAAESRLHYRDLVVDLDTREAALDGRPLDLTAGNSSCCAPFWPRRGGSSPGRCCSPGCGATTSSGDERVVDSHIKTSATSWADYIETVRGVGYRAAKETR